MTWWSLGRVEEEAESAQAKYGPFTSTHEAYGVLAEELKELLDAIHLNDIEAIKGEAIQVAAVATRLAEQCATAVPSFTNRSGI